ncbi:aminoacyl-tRNA deacylase [Thiosocius teredinicola]|uniref:aminoacyl-tRNA deacylase n=1 Tax=Thiosocius teredinicola TaxID=1973002 RepID=UPI00099132DB
MAVAISLREFLDDHHLPYDIERHPHTQSSRDTAEASHHPADRVAKCLLLKDDERYLLMVLPADRRLHLGELHRSMNRPICLATEDEVAKVFADCETGAIPPAGLLYDLDTIIDDVLLMQPDVYFEAGDHEQLIHMKQADFRKLVGDASHGDYSCHD